MLLRSILSVKPSPLSRQISKENWLERSLLATKLVIYSDVFNRVFMQIKSHFINFKQHLEPMLRSLEKSSRMDTEIDKTHSLVCKVWQKELHSESEEPI